MQGRQGPDQDNDSWERTPSQPSQRLSGSNGTGKQRAVPQRPPGMARVEPPPTRRVARPRRDIPSPRRRRRRFLLWGSILVVTGIIVIIIVWSAILLFRGTSAAGPSANLAVDFISSLDTQNYDKAWADLGPPITLHPQSEFTQAAQTADSCYGIVTDYKLIDSNTTVSSDSKTWTYGYTITRSKLSHPYTLTLTIQEDAQGNWQVTAYSNGSTTTNDLGPANTPCHK